MLGLGSHVSYKISMHCELIFFSTSTSRYNFRLARLKILFEISDPPCLLLVPKFQTGQIFYAFFTRIESILFARGEWLQGAKPSNANKRGFRTKSAHMSAIKKPLANPTKSENHQRNTWRYRLLRIIYGKGKWS